MPVTNDDEKEAYTKAVNALTTVKLDEAKVKTLNYNGSTVAEWVTNASTAKVKGTEAVANGEFFVANEGEKTIALTGTITDLKSNIDKVKKAAPALVVSFTPVSGDSTTPTFTVQSGSVYILKVSDDKAVYCVGDDLTTDLVSNYTQLTDQSAITPSSDITYVTGNKYAVVHVDDNKKVVAYAIVTLQDQQ